MTASDFFIWAMKKETRCQMGPLGSLHIVACHLSKGSQFRWREDMSGGFTNVAFQMQIGSLLQINP